MVIAQRPLIHWYSKNIQTAKRHRGYCERLWVRPGLSIHFEMFQVARLNVRNILDVTKSQYYNNKIKEYKGNQSTVFGVLDKVLHLNHTVVPKIITSNKYMAHDFNNVF